MIITCGILLAAAATAATVIMIESPTSWHTSSLPQTAATTTPKDNRTGKIIIESESGACSKQTFDNKTGRLSPSQQPCDAAAYDNDGFSVDPDAVRRFNDLKQSFSTPHR